MYMYGGSMPNTRFSMPGSTMKGKMRVQNVVGSRKMAMMPLKSGKGCPSGAKGDTKLMMGMRKRQM